MLYHTLIKYSSLFLQDINKVDVRVFLESSPNYPNLLAVVQTMQYVGLNVRSGQCDWNYLNKLHSPFLIHLKVKSHEMLVIAKWDKTSNSINIFNLSKNKWETKSRKDIESIWDGVVIYTNTKQRKTSNKQYLLLLSISITLCISLSLLSELVSTFYAIPIVIGTTLSLCLYWRESVLGIHFIDKLCRITSITDCNIVANSLYGSIFKIKLNSIALTFFLSKLICIIIAKLFGVNGIFYTLYSISAILFIPTALYSIYSQVKIKKVCPLCVLILICIFAETILFIKMTPQSLNITLLIIWCGISFCIINILHYVSNMHSKQIKQLDEKIRLLTLKRKRGIILLESVSTGQISSPMWFGSKNSPITITTIITPSCKHCKKMIQDVLLLIDSGYIFKWNIILGKITNSDIAQIGIWIRQYIKDKDQFLNNLFLWSRRDGQILSSLSEDTIINIKISEVYQVFDNLITKLNVSEFPKLIFNNRLLSSIYSSQDLEYMLIDQHVEYNDIIKKKRSRHKTYKRKITRV